MLLGVCVRMFLHVYSHISHTLAHVHNTYIHAVEIAIVRKDGDKLEYKLLDNPHLEKVLKELDLAQPSTESS
jgi:hypothetical protein